jgi:N utilization substance protein B
MFSRHQLRQRILQGLYAYYQSEELTPAQTEQNIIHAVEKIYDLYLLLLILFKEYAHEEHLYRTDVQAKFLTKKTDASPNSIEGNLILKKLNENKKLAALIKKKKLSWQNDSDMIKKIFYKIRKSAEYNAFLKAEEVTPQDERDFFLKMFKKFVIKNELFVNYLEEKNIFWADGFQFCCEMAVKTFKTCANDPEPVIQDQFRDDTEDREFIHTLVFETIRNDAYWESLITSRLKNWDTDRVALIDFILMKLALSEIVYVETVPVKVSINEYIELSKEYSTPKSNLFINGVIDKVVIDLRNENKIVKTGRGLID